jgi:hypothetical protein
MYSLFISYQLDITWHKIIFINILQANFYPRQADAFARQNRSNQLYSGTLDGTISSMGLPQNYPRGPINGKHYRK